MSVRISAGVADIILFIPLSYFLVAPFPIVPKKGHGGRFPLGWGQAKDRRAYPFYGKALP
jgi:hypothetical protein